MRNISRGLVARVGGLVIVGLLVATFGALFVRQASLRDQGVRPLAGADTPTPVATDTPLATLTLTPSATDTPLSTPSPGPAPTPTATPVPSSPAKLVLDSASGGSIAGQPGEWQFSATVSTAPLHPNVVENFTVSYCDQQFIGGTYLDPTGHATFRSGPILVKCSFPFTVTLTVQSLTQGPAGDEPLQGSASFTISS